MDRGGRILRSLGISVSDNVPNLSMPRIAVPDAPAIAVGAPITPRHKRRGAPKRTAAEHVTSFVETKARVLGYFVVTGLFAAVAIYGTIYNGEFAAFIQREGALHDIVARDLGFGIKTITISGISEVAETEVLSAGGISPKSSLLFIDAAEVRRKLMMQPLIKEASITKLYPNRLIVTITERVPSALWQKNGFVTVLASDGTNLGERRDRSHDDLPFVVGESADAHIGEYVKILQAAGELKPMIRAGTLVAGRRWDLTMKSSMTVKLPEINAEGALATLIGLEQRDNILHRDLVSLDLRMPGRVVARLTEEAFAARAAALPKKTVKAKGSQT